MLETGQNINSGFVVPINRQLLRISSPTLGKDFCCFCLSVVYVYEINLVIVCDGLWEKANSGTINVRNGSGSAVSWKLFSQVQRLWGLVTWKYSKFEVFL